MALPDDATAENGPAPRALRRHAVRRKVSPLWWLKGWGRLFRENVRLFGIIVSAIVLLLGSGLVYNWRATNRGFRERCREVSDFEHWFIADASRDGLWNYVVYIVDRYVVDCVETPYTAIVVAPGGAQRFVLTANGRWVTSSYAVFPHSKLAEASDRERAAALERTLRKR